MFDKLNLNITNIDDIPSGHKLNFQKIFSILDLVDTPKKRESYLLSRYSLKKSLEQRNLFLTLDNLIVQEHQYIYDLPNLLCSLSHTKDYGASIVGTRKDIKSLGIDIEKKNRVIKEGAQKYFINDQDQLSSYSELTQWVIKEACYKASSNALKEEFLLKDVICSEKDFHFNDIKGYYKLIPHSELIVVIAYVQD